MARGVATNRKVQTSCWRIDLGGFAEGTELVPGKAGAVCGSRAGDRTTVLPLFHEATVAGSWDKTRRLPGAGWSLWDVPGMLVFRTRI